MLATEKSDVIVIATTVNLLTNQTMNNDWDMKRNRNFIGIKSLLGKQIILAVGLLMMVGMGLGQTVTTGDYRNSASTSLNSTSGWQVFNGTTWGATSTAPTSATTPIPTNIFIIGNYTVNTGTNVTMTSTNIIVGDGTNAGILTIGGASAAHTLSIASLTINNNGTVTPNGTNTGSGLTLNATGSSVLTVNTGGALKLGASYTATAGKVNTTFAGAGNVTVSNAGGSVDFNNLTLNMGSSASNTLTMNPVFTIATASTTQTLTITNGTLSIASASTISPYGSSAATICSSTGGLTLNNASASINSIGGSSTVPVTHTVNGLLTVTAGTFNVGKTDYTSTATLAVGASPASVTVNGGTINCYGTYSVNSTGSTTISSGSITIPAGGGVTNAGTAILKLGSSCSVNISGTGAFNVKSRNPYSGTFGDVYISTTGTWSVTNSSAFNFSDASYIAITSSKDLYGVSISKGGGSGTTVLMYGSFSISNNLSIDATSVFDVTKYTLTATSTTTTGGVSTGKIRLGPGSNGLTSTLSSNYTIEYYNTFAINTILANSSTTATLDQTNPYYNFAASNSLITATSGTGVSTNTYVVSGTSPTLTLSVAPTSLSATTQTVTFTFPYSTNPTISSVPANNQIVVSSATNLQVGQVINGSSYYPQGTYIVSMTGTNLTTITLSNSYTTLPSGTALTFLGLTNNIALLTSGSYANLIVNTYNTAVSVATAATVTTSLNINNTGNITVGTGLTLTLGGTITINSTGGINTTLNNATGTVLFNGGSAQTIPAGTFVSNLLANGTAGPSNVYALTVSNTAGVTLNQSITVSGTGGLTFGSSSASLTVLTGKTLTTSNTPNITGTLTINHGATFVNSSGLTLASTGILNIGESTLTSAVDGTEAMVTFANSGTYTWTSGGIINLKGYLKVSGGTAIPNTTILNVDNYAVYEHNLSGGTIPTATSSSTASLWPTTSVLYVTGTAGATPSGTNQTFGNVIWNCSGQTTPGAFNAVAINGALNIINTNSNTFRLLTSATSVVIGNGITVGSSSFSFNGGTLITPANSAKLDLSNGVTGAVTVTGGISVGTDGTLSSSSTSSLSLTGNWSNAGTFTSTNTTVNFNGSATQTITTGQSFAALTISNKNVTIPTTLTATGLLTISVGSGNTLSQPVNTTINSSGGLTVNAGTFEIAGLGTSLSSVTASANNAVFNSTGGTRTLTGTLSIKGYFYTNLATAFTLNGGYGLTVASNAVFEAAATTTALPVATSWNANSYLYLSASNQSASPTSVSSQTFGNVIWNSPGQLQNYSVTIFDNVAGTLYVLNTGASNSFQLRLANATLNIGNLQIGGSFTINGATINAASATLDINKLASSETVNVSNVTIGASTTNATLQASSATTINITGDWKNSGTFTSTNTTVNFNGTTGGGGTIQNITTGQSFNKLTISNSNVVIPTTLTVTGLLYIDPATGNTLTQPVNTTITASGGLTVNSGTFSIAGTTSTLASNTASSNNAVFNLTGGTTTLTGTLAIGGYYYNSVATAYTMNTGYGFTVAANGVYEAAANGVTLPTATGIGWNANSYLYLSGNLTSNPAITSASQLFGNVIFNPSGLSQNYTYSCFSGGIAGTLYVLNTVSSSYQLRLPNAITIGNIQVGGSFTINGATINASSATLDLNRTGAGGTLTTGDVTIGANGIITSYYTSTITVTGNWSNGGTFTNTGITVNFNNTTPANQNIGLTVFNNVTINNTAGVTLTGNVWVGGVLTLSAGRVTTGSNTLILSNVSSATAALSGTTGTSAYINGNLKRYVSNTYSNWIFPVGQYTGGTDYYYPFTLNTISTSGTDSVTVYATNGSTGGSSDGTTGTLSANEYWAVVATPAITSTLTVNSADIGSNALLGASTTLAGTYTSIGGISPSNATSLSSSALYIVPALTAQPAPAITSISSSYPSGTTTFYRGSVLTITGANYLVGTTSVTIGGASVASGAVTVTATGSSSSLYFTVPSTCTGNSITVTTTTGGASAAYTSGTYNNGYLSVADADWSTASTWGANAVPSAGSTVIVNSQVTINANVASPANLTINSGDSLSMGTTNAGAQIIVSGTFINNGKLNVGVPATAGNYYSYFTSNGTAINNGTINIHRGSTNDNLILGGVLTNSGTIVDSAILQINNGGSISGNGVAYGNLANLYYNTGAIAFTPTNEWVAGATSGGGVPQNVTVGANQGSTIASGTNLSVTGSQTLLGSFTINSGYSVAVGSSASVACGNFSNAGTVSVTGNINASGSWTNTGTFTATAGTVSLTGGSQTIAGSSTFYNLTKSVVSAATLTLPAGGTQTVNGTLTLNGASGQLLTVTAASASTIAPANPSAASIYNTSITNITNSNATSMFAAASTNGGGNTNITFNSYTWTGTTSTDYTVATNWSPNRLHTSSNDVLTFNNGAINTVSNIPTQTIYQLNVSGANTTVDLQAGAANNVLTIAGDNNTGTYDLNVAATDSLNLTGTNELVIRLGTNATADILGNVRLDNAVQVLDATYNTGAVINFESGSTCQTGANFPAANSSSNYPFTNISINDNARVVFKSGSKYYNNGGNSPLGGGGTVQSTNFQTGSIYYHQQAGTAAYQMGIFAVSQARTFGIFIWNNASTLIGTSGSASTTTFDSIAVLQGSFGSNFNNSTGYTTFNLNEGVYIATGARLVLGSTTNATVLNFQGSTPQYVNGGGNMILGNSTPSSSTNPYIISITNTSGVVLEDSLTLCSTSCSYTGSGSIDVSSSAATLYFIQSASITIPSVFGTSIGNLTAAVGSSNTLSLSGNTTIAGNLILNSGIFDATTSNYNLNLGGNLTTFSQGTFNARNGTVTLNGGNQTIYGANTFYNLSKVLTSATPATLTLPSGTTARTTITNSLTLNGYGPTGQLTLVASVSGTPAYITPPTTVSLSYLLVKDNSSLTTLTPTNSSNLGNNTNWYFGAATWTGATDTKWTTASNWSAGVLPASSDSVIIATTTANQLALDANETVGTLIVNSGNIVNGGSYTLTIANNLTNNGTFNGGTGTVTFAGTGTVSGTGNVNFNIVNVTAGTTTVGATGTTGNITFGNTLTINSGSTFKYATTSTTFISGNVVNNGTLNGSSATIYFNGTTVLSGSGSYTFNGLSITGSGSLTSTSGTIFISGSYANAGIFINNGGTVNFNGASSFCTVTGSLTGTSGISYGAFNNITFSGTGAWSFGSSADILGNLNNSGTGTIKASTAVTISVGGTWNNSGTFTNTNTTINFNGVSAQAIPATAFNSLTINNASGVTLTGNVTVAGILTMNSGLLNPSSFTLTVTSTAAGAVVGGSSSSYINGALTRAVVASTSNVYIFPVGNGGVYLADTITSTTAAGNIAITPTASASGGSADGTTIASISSNEYWVVNSSVANTITLVARPTTTTSFGVLGESTTQAGTYVSDGGFITSTSIGATSISLAAGNNYFVVAVASISAPTISAVTSCVTNTSSFFAMDTLTLTGANFQVSSTVTIGGYAASIQGTPTSTSMKVVVSASGISNAGSNNNTFIITNSGGTTTYSTANGNAVASFNLGYTTRYDGYWDDGSWNASVTPSGSNSIWLGGVQPPSSNKVVTINNTVTLKSSVISINSLRINTGATINTANIGMTFNTGGVLTNNGTFNGQTNTVTFSGAGTVTGANAATFSSLTINGALAFTTSPTINGTLTLNANSSVMGNAPSYGTSSVIAYNLGTTVTPGTEWTVGATSGAGVPYRVNVNNGNTLNLASGTYTVLNLLAAYGNITSSGGSLNLANASLWFSGSAAQTINIGTAQPNVYSISIANAAGTTLQSSMTITNGVSFQSGVLTTSASNLLTLSATASFKSSSSSYINGPLARVITSTTRDTFPVGISGVYQPITFAYASTPSSAETVTVTPATSIPGTKPGNVSTVQFGSASWNIAQSATGYNYTIGIGNGGIANTSGGSVVIARREGVGSYATSATSYTSTPYQVYTSSSTFSTTNTSNDVFLAENNIPVYITSAAVSDKTYDGTTTATISAAGTLTGVLSGDAVSFTASAAFPSKSVSAGVNIVSNYTLTGANAGAYSLSQPSITASITAASLTITANDVSKNYGSTLLGGAGSTAFTSSGLVNGETIGTVTISYNGGGAASAPATTYNITPSSPLAGTGSFFLASNYSITFVNGTLTVNTGSHGVWVGITNTDFNTASNWADNTVPAAGDDIIVNSGATYNPVLSADVTVGSLVFASGTTLGLGGNTLTVNNEISGGGTLTATATSGLALNGITGTINFTSGNNTLQNLTLNSGATVTLGSALKIASGTGAGAVTIGSGATLTTGSNLTLLSDSLGTASIAPLLGTLSGSVTVQRYISAKTARKYTMVGSPVTQSIHSAWQQQVYITGAGTGGSVCGSANSNGFDVTSVNTPSMYNYNASLVNGSRWVSVPNTSSNLVPGIGYLMNIRGDRTLGSCYNQLASNTPAPPTAVTLSATGNVDTGNVVVNLNAPTTHLFTLVANPYPSTISFGNLYLNNEGSINNNMWSYSPFGNGNYTTYSSGTLANAASGYTNLAGNGDWIASGQAFFVQAANAASGTASVTFQESDKISSVPPNTQYFGAAIEKMLRVGLKTITNTNLDEIVVRFRANGSPVYNAAIDATSLNTGSQVLATLKGKNRIAIATLPQTITNDTAQLAVTSSTIGSYRLVFSDYAGLDNSISIVLRDKFLQTTQDIRSNQQYDFNITNDTASQGSNRFDVIFTAGNPLPVSFTNIGVSKVNNSAIVKWQVANVATIASYSVERSIDGNKFVGIATTQATKATSYSVADNQLPAGVNTVYYRIKSIGVDGAVSYSSIASLITQNSAVNTIAIYPDPVKESLNISWMSATSVTYKLRVLSVAGKEVMNKQVASTNLTKLSIPATSLASGVYMLELTDEHGNKQQQKFVKE